MDNIGRIACAVVAILALIASVPVLFGCQYRLDPGRGSATWGYWGVDSNEPILLRADRFQLIHNAHANKCDAVRHSIYLGKIVIYSPY